MILTVTLNPAMDVTITVDTLEAGATHRVEPAARRAGGKGVNVARVLTAQGIPATALACVDDGTAGEEFAADLRRAGILHALLPAESALRSSVTIVERSTGRATVLNERGEHPGDAAVSGLLDRLRAAPAGCLVVSGSLPEGMDAGAVAEIVSDAGERGVPTVVDGGGAVLRAAADAGASLLKPNADELRAAVPDAAGPVAAARALMRRGAGEVVVTLGERGMLHIGVPDVRSARLPRVLVGNPTGAGDAATAALAVGIHRAGRVDDGSLRRAVAWSAAAVLAPVAGDLDPVWTALRDEVVSRAEEEEWAWPS